MVMMKAKLLLLFFACLREVQSMAKKKQCVCVKIYLCNEDDYVDIHGTNVMEPRQIRCRDDEVCCNLLPQSRNHSSKPVTKTITTVTEKYRAHHTCGLKIYNRSPLGFQRIENISDISVGTFYGEIPWIVAIFNNAITGTRPSKTIKNEADKFICAGSLIAADVILTAAYCIRRVRKANIIVRAGDWYTNPSTELLQHQERKVREKIVHGGFDSATLRNDIALLILETPFQLNEAIDTVCIPQDNSLQQKECLASGWRISDNGVISTTLKAAELSVLDWTTCQNKSQESVNENFALHRGFTCAAAKKDKSACVNDLGGPLVCAGFKGDDVKFGQIGIASWNLECPHGSPAFYTSVGQFYGWIVSHVGLPDS